MDQNERKTSKKLKSQKSDCSVLDTKVFGFIKTDRVRVGSEI
jgi:hypothetical protein